jgi:hypothetical protein
MDAGFTLSCYVVTLFLEKTRKKALSVVVVMVLQLLLLQATITTTTLMENLPDAH